MTRFVPFWLGVVAGSSLLLSAACKPTKPEPQVPPPVAAATEDKLTAESLAPVFELVSASEGAPNRLEVRFAKSLVDPKDATGTVTNADWSIRPTMKGALTWADPSTWVFTPEAGFPFSQQFDVLLRSVPTRLGTRRPPSENAWRYRFETPAFAFLRMLPHKVDIQKGELAIDLVFSGAIDAASLRSRISVRVDATRVSDYKLTSEEQGTVARLFAKGLRLSPESEVSLTLASGVKALAGGQAPPAETRIRLFSGEPVTMKRVTLQEGPSGFYVDVLCDDAGSKTTRDNWYWDPVSHESFRDLSQRCQPTEEALSHIQVTPAVKLSLSPTQHGFRLLGDFQRGTYTLTLLAGLPTLDGGSLRETNRQTIRVPARASQVGFGASGRYLPRAAWRNLPVRHLNVDTAELEVRQIPPENLVFWLSNDSSEAADERTSNLILKRTLTLSRKEDAWATTFLDVGAWIPATTTGVLELRLNAPGVERPAVSRLVLTDLALVAKKTVHTESTNSGEVWVWALDARTGAPVSGVEVSAVRKSGKRVDQCITDEMRGCHLKTSAADVDTQPPFALLARQGADLTYLRYEDLEISLSESDVGGAGWDVKSPYEAFLFADRGVFRPGEVAHLAGIIRDERHRAAKAGMPVVLKVLDPQSKELLRRTLSLNDAGLVTLDVPFADFAATGRYTAELEVGAVSLTALRFNVEEFVPERMKVLVSPEAAHVEPGTAAKFQVEAKYLFGSAPANADVELTCTLSPHRFTPKKAANYQFGPVDLARSGKPPAFDPARSKLDDKGTAALTCPSIPKQEQPRPYRLLAQAAVTEAGSGRASVGEGTVEVHPERFYIGLRSNLTEVKAGDTLKVEATLVDWEGNTASSLSGKSVDVELFDVYRESSGWFDEGEGSERQEERYRLSRSAVQRGVFSGKPFDVSFVAKRGEWNWMGYVVRARLGNAVSELKIEGDGAEWYWDSGVAGGRVDRTPKPMRPMPLRIEVPARSRVGQPITAKFTLPFRGHLLLTAESDRILDSEWKVVDAGETTWTFTPHQNTSTVYVSALLVKAPYAESRETFLPNRAFSVSAIALEPVDHAQTVTLSVANEVRSGAELDIGLALGKTDGTTYANVAVVDEGVLQLTKAKLPDPLAGLFQKKALGVTTFETIGWSLLMPPTGASRPTGGDGAQAAGLGRAQPIRPVALWSGWVKFDGAGRARVKLKLPTYRGAVRVMAVTAGESRVGSAEALVRVTDPLVLMSTLPRFVTQGDAVQIPVFVTNLTGQKQDVRVVLSADNIPVAGVTSLGDASPLQLLGKPEGLIPLAAGASGTAVFQAKASKGLGTATLRVKVQAGGHQSEETLVVPFSPQGQRERRVQMVELKDSSLDLKPLVRGWVPTTEKTTFWVTTNPYGESFGHLKSLIHYPYGCIEQTTSSARPLLYVSNMLGEIDPELIASRKVEDMVASGIARVLSMQTPSGGFGYWPGEKEPNTWGTAYATHFLLDAQKAGFPVPHERLQDAVRWMESVVSGAERVTEDPYHGNHNANAYTHYVLALAGKGRKAQLQALTASLSNGAAAATSGGASEGERLETAYMLKAALWHAGDRRYEKDLRSPDVSAVTDVRSNTWSFYSDRRRRGFMLSTFTDLFGNDPAGEPLARLVAEALRGRTSAEYTTQELVWGISGLGKRLQGAARAAPAPKLWANGKTVAHSPRAQGAQGTSFSLVRASEIGALRIELAEPPKGKMFLVVSSEGIPTAPKTTFGGEGLAIRRKIRTMSGEAIDPREPRKLGETFVVELSVTNLTRERVENIALVDRIPAGWEIENPRLGRGGIPWVEADSLWPVSAMNVRDDRIELFGPLEKERTATFVYTVRATAAGTFHRPSVEAEAMYDPRIWAREKGGEVRVEGGWADHLL